MLVCVKGVVVINALQKALENLAESSGFKKAVQTSIAKEIRPGNSAISKAAKQNAEWYAERMREIVAAHMDTYGLGKYSDMSISVKQLSNGMMQVSLSFDQNSNLSPSLNQNRKPVVLPRLLNTGFHTKSDIWGLWSGAYIHGLRDRDAEEFLQEAVTEFNVLYKGEAIAEYHPQDAY